MAGKKQEVVEVLLKLSDGNTIPVLAKKAKKAAKDMDGLGRASQATDRRIKGVTQQSSNATKNFSKQAQTMQGGLVAAYATIAAQVFAMSAAFQFLKNSVDMSNMHQGQEAFASITGTAYKTLTADIQAATDGQLMFKQAAEAAAIGTAAGLTGEQLERLGAAAKNTSMALGRDLTDSFNRLVRGTTKAEPELLDELGIILRLEPALKAYAAAVKKPVSQLTQFEKSQAIANEVLEQAESKFGAISEEMDSGAYALSQFMVAFDELFQKLQKGVGAVAKFVLPFFTNNVLALAGALGLILAPVLKSLFGEGLANMADNATLKAQQAGQAARDAADDAAYAQQKYKEARGEGGPDYSQGKKEMDEFGVKSGKGQPAGQMSQRQINAYRKSLQNRNGIAKNMDGKRRRSFERMLKRQEIALKSTTGKMQGQWTRTTTWFNMQTKKMAAVYQGAMVKIKNATAMMARGVNKAMALMGWVGIIMMIGSALMSLGKWIFGEDEAAKKEKEWLESTTERYKTLGKELDGIIKKSSDLSAEQQMIQSGNALGSIQFSKFVKDMNEAINKTGEMDKKLKQELMGIAENIDEITGGRGKALIKHLEEETEVKTELKLIGGELVNVYQGEMYALDGLIKTMVSGAHAASKFSQAQKQLSQAIQRGIGGVKQLKGADLQLAFSGYLSEARSQLAGQKENLISKNPGQDFSFDAAGGAKFTDKKTFFGSSIGTAEQMEERKRLKKQEAKIESTIGGLKRGERRGPGGILPPLAGGYFDQLEEVKKKLLENEKVIQKTNELLGDTLIAYNNKLEIVKNAEAVEARINLIQSDELDLTRALMKNKMKAANAAYGTVAEIKKKQITIKQEAQLLKLEKARQSVMSAQLMLVMARDEVSTGEGGEGDAQKIAGAEEGLRQANELLRIERQLTDNAERQARDSRAAAQTKEDQVRSSEKLVRLNLRIADASEEAKNLSNDSLSYEEDRYAKMYTLMVQHYKRDVLLNKQAAAQKAIDNYEAEHGKVGAMTKGVIVKVGGKVVDNSGGEYDTDVNAKFSIGDVVGDYTGDEEKLGRMRTTLKDIGFEISNLDTVLQNSREGAMDKLLGKGFIGLMNKGRTDFSALFGGGLDINPASQEYNKQLKKLGVGSDAGLKKALETQMKSDTITTSQGFIDSTDKEKFFEDNMKTLKLTVEQSDELEQNFKQAKLNLAEAAIETKNLAIETELAQGIADTLSNGFTSMFQALIDGSKSFKDSMKDLAKSVLADLAAMFLKAAALKMMMAFMPGGSTVMSMLQGGRYGGEMTGGSKGYAYGGVADGPNSGYMATLHGREAVVPLGNDRSIPVEMRGGGGGGNTVNVSINMSGGGGSSVTGDGMQGLGRSIGGLVQQHLQQEMRPGGLLNPQGTKGRG